MAKVNIDMSQAVSFEALPEGTYECQLLEKPEQFVSKESNTPCLKWTMTVVGSNGQEEYKDKKIFRNTTMTGKGAGFTEECLAGFQIPFEAEGEEGARSISFDDDDSIGKTALVSVKQGMYNNKPNNEVTAITPIVEASAEVEQ